MKARNSFNAFGRSCAALAACAGAASSQPYCSARSSTLAAVDQSHAHAGWAVAATGPHLFYGAPDFDQGAGVNSGKIIRREVFGGGWTFGQTIVPPALDDNSRAGRSLGADGQWLIIGGAGGAMEGGRPTGRAWMYRYDGTNYNYHQTLIPAGLAAGDDYGYSVAVDGEYAIIGAPGDDELAANAGAVHFYRLAGNTWTYYDKVTLFVGAQSNLGLSVACEGSTMVAGCPGYDSFPKQNNGAVFVFRKFGSAWTLTDSLYGESDGDRHGYAVATDGDYIAVGNPDDDHGGFNGCGSVTIYKWNGSDYVFNSLVTCPEAMDNGQFGTSVDLRGNYLAVGAAGNNKMYAFRLIGSSWRVETAAPGSNGDASFPLDVAITQTGIAGGDPLDDHTNINAYTDSGTVRHINIDDSHGADSWWLTPMDSLPIAEYGCTEFATPSLDPEIPGTCGASIDSPDVWYWFAAHPGTLVIECHGTGGFDPVLTLYGPALGTASLACNDDVILGNRDSRIVYEVTQLGMLNLRVSGFNGSRGQYELHVRYECEVDLSGSSDPNDDVYGAPDGTVDSSDFFYFLDQFTGANTSVADLTSSSDPNDAGYGTPDGVVDASDFFYYLDLFVSGCP